MARDRDGGSGEAQAPREVELKLLLERPALKALRLVGAAGDWALGPPRRARLRSVYYDTQDQRLRRAGLTLRVRRKGRTFVQTIKSETQITQGLSTPIEIEARVRNLAPDLAKIGDPDRRSAMASLIGDAPLIALFETNVLRTTRRLLRGETELELALDDGEIRAGERCAPILEAELELKAGAGADMVSAARALFEAHPFHLAGAAKSARGYALLAAGPEPEAAGPAAIRLCEAKTSCLDALTAILGHACAQIVAARDVALATDEPEGAHQIRVGLRRLRTALRAFRPLTGEAGQILAEQAGDLARIVGRQRDADVLLDEICAPLAREAGEAGGFAALQDVLARHRAAMREEARQALDGPVWRGFALELALWPMGLPQDPALEAPLGAFASEALARAWKKAARCARSMKTLDVAERHELRKALKKLRYTAEFFEGLFPQARVKPFMKRLRRLQDDFGYLNDAANAAQLVALVRAEEGADPAAFEAAGYVLGWHTARAEACWRDARREWTALKAQARFWA